MVIAVAGKGGVGKSTLAALIVRHLVDRKETPVLAVDADPNSTLAEKLGVKADLTIGDIREDALHEKYDAPAGVPKQRTVEYRVEQTLVEGAGFDLVVMGRGEGPGCYCSLNNMLRTFLHGLSSRYRHVVLDNEAGMEHLSRRTNDKVDLMLVVSDPTPTSLQAAGRISQLAMEFDIVRGRMGLIVNRTPVGSFSKDLAMSATGMELIGCVPDDPLVRDLEFSSKPLLGLPSESEAVLAIEEILTTIGISATAGAVRA